MRASKGGEEGGWRGEGGRKERGGLASSEQGRQFSNASTVQRSENRSGMTEFRGFNNSTTTVCFAYDELKPLLCLF